MSDTALISTVQDELIRHYRTLGTRVEQVMRALPKDEVWKKPYAYGNSVGHLVLHLTGNLNHFIGAEIAKSGYVRDRPREFTDASPPAPEDVLARFQETIDLVDRTIRSLDAASCSAAAPAGPPGVATQFGLLLACASHMNNHIGQMSYLLAALGRSTEAPPAW